jgi:hypothetical protein
VSNALDLVQLAELAGRKLAQLSATSEAGST